jgi:hypothetical protein
LSFEKHDSSLGFAFSTSFEYISLDLIDNGPPDLKRHCASSQ